MTVNKNIEKKSNVPRPRGGPQVELGGGAYINIWKMKTNVSLKLQT